MYQMRRGPCSLVIVPAEEPGQRQRVTYLLDSMKTVEPKVLAGMAAIEQDELVKQ